MHLKSYAIRSTFDLFCGCFPGVGMIGACALFAYFMPTAKADLRSDYRDQRDREVGCNKLWAEAPFAEISGKSRYIVDYKLPTFAEISIRDTSRVALVRSADFPYRKVLGFVASCKAGSPISLDRELWPMKGGGFTEKLPLQFDLDDLVSPSRKTLFVIEAGALVRYSNANDPGSIDSHVSRVVIALKRKGI